MIYSPDVPPTEPEHLQQYLLNEFQKMSAALTSLSVATEAELNALTAQVNGGAKRIGLRVMVSETNKQVYASGKNPADNWVYENGDVAYSPI